ncbi:MAG TPA: exonuclease domain-containing protein [Gammaproteobacteria bacterium]
MSWAHAAVMALRRQWLARRARPGALRDCLVHAAVDRRRRWDAVEYLVLDFETTGVDAGSAEILSAGYLLIRAGAIHLDSARHRLVRPQGALTAATVVIHGITHDRSAEGEALAAVVDELLAALAGRVLVGHHVATELAFLSAACRAVHGTGFAGPAIDTLELEARCWRRRQARPRRGELRLGGARARRGLPRYRAHDALVDALATAELFLAQAHELGAPRLGELLYRG